MSSGIFGRLFSFKECYSYNKESFAFIDCVLLEAVGDKLAKGTVISEAIVNVKNSKVKFNIGESLFIIPFGLTWLDDNISQQNIEIDDSDFDNEESDDEDDDDSSESSDSDQDD